MALKVGTRLGPYHVTAKIGEGDMGEVYRARDTKLDRDVALKVLPHAFTDDPDRLTRPPQGPRSSALTPTKRSTYVDTNSTGGPEPPTRFRYGLHRPLQLGTHWSPWRGSSCSDRRRR